MKTATVDSAASDHHLNHLHSESIPLIDLRFLSQSELLSLSLCSSSSSSSLHHLQNDTDVSTPKIDRSVFNESAGSRKQTFSRLRLAPRNNNNNSQYSPSNQIPPQDADQTLDEENFQILSILKSLFGAGSNENENHNNLVSVPIQYTEYLNLQSIRDMGLKDVPIGGTEVKQKQGIPAVIADSASKKRKRGRPRKYENNLNVSNKIQVVESAKKEVESVEEKRKVEMMVMVNKNGVVVDSVALGRVEEPYREEMRRRTEGMQTEAELLGFLQGLEGRWASRRNKRRIVDAGVFGDALPIGWKLILCIKRKAGHAWLGCRRYIRFLTNKSCFFRFCVLL